MSDVLFTVTKENLETGMRGYPIGYCVTSFVDPKVGLHYAGVPIRELAFKKPEEVIFLLQNGYEGTRNEVDDLRAELKKRCCCSEEVIEGIYHFPKGKEPMKHLAMGILLLGIHHKSGEYREGALDLIAKIPHLTAAVINHYMGWGETPQPDPEMGYMESFIAMLNVPNKNPELLEPILTLFNILHYDHGGGNLSTFVGKATSSGLEDIYGSISAAMCALGGTRHGGANEDALNLVKSIVKSCGDEVTREGVQETLKEKVGKNELIFGFGHAVLRAEDPRATLFYEYVEKHFPNDPLVKAALLLREEGVKILMENPKISNPHPNIDAISGTALSVVGFGYPECFPLLFGLARVVGIAIQIVYERHEARGGKGVPIMRPVYFYRSRG